MEDPSIIIIKSLQKIITPSMSLRQKLNIIKNNTEVYNQIQTFNDISEENTEEIYLSRRDPTNTIPRYRYIGYSDDENYEDILKFPKVNDETKKEIEKILIKLKHYEHILYYSLENPHYYHKLTLLVTVDTLFDTLEDIIKNRNNTETTNKDHITDFYKSITNKITHSTNTRSAKKYSLGEIVEYIPNESENVMIEVRILKVHDNGNYDVANNMTYENVSHSKLHKRKAMYIFEDNYIQERINLVKKKANT